MVDKELYLKYIFPMHIRGRIDIEAYRQNLEEIRVRVGQPIEFIHSMGSGFLKLENDTCMLVAASEVRKEELYHATRGDVAEMMNYISNYSLYAYKDELRQGYITMEGGHRVGMAGGAVMEHGGVMGILPVTFLNIRVAHEHPGCASFVLPYIYRENGIYNTLFFSEPGAGKTTVLRDCIRLLSDGTREKPGMKVCVVDERSEIAASHIGVPQNDVGVRTDVLCGCEKTAGIQILLRSMSPQVLAVDELGCEEDFLAVEQAAYSGCRVVGTIHAGDVNELREKLHLKKWSSRGVFQRYVWIKRAKNGARSWQIYNAQMERLC